MCGSCFRAFSHDRLLPCYCWHNYCGDCVTEMVDAAIAVDFMVPVRCCEMIIPLKWPMLKMPPAKITLYMNRKEEVESRGIIYCYQNDCRMPIHPQYIIYQEAICGKCHSSTCARCRGAFHRGVGCGGRQTQDAQRLHDLAVTYGWGKCHACNSYIQLTPGRNHLLCICGTETCFTCGRAWRACACIRPNHNAVTDELGQAMQMESGHSRQRGLIPPIHIRDQPLDDLRIR